MLPAEASSDSSHGALASGSRSDIAPSTCSKGPSECDLTLGEIGLQRANERGGAQTRRPLPRGRREAAIIGRAPIGAASRHNSSPRHGAARAAR
jgi:hypothetical protein